METRNGTVTISVNRYHELIDGSQKKHTIIMYENCGMSVHTNDDATKQISDLYKESAEEVRILKEAIDELTEYKEKKAAFKDQIERKIKNKSFVKLFKWWKKD